MNFWKGSFKKHQDIFIDRRNHRIVPSPSSSPFLFFSFLSLSFSPVITFIENAAASRSARKFYVILPPSLSPPLPLIPNTRQSCRSSLPSNAGHLININKNHDEMVIRKSFSLWIDYRGGCNMARTRERVARLGEGEEAVGQSGEGRRDNSDRRERKRRHNENLTM